MILDFGMIGYAIRNKEKIVFVYVLKYQGHEHLAKWGYQSKLKKIGKRTDQEQN